MRSDWIYFDKDATPEKKFDIIRVEFNKLSMDVGNLYYERQHKDERVKDIRRHLSNLGLAILIGFALVGVYSLSMEMIGG